jgi:hypothetical protein
MSKGLAIMNAVADKMQEGIKSAQKKKNAPKAAEGSPAEEASESPAAEAKEDSAPPAMPKVKHSFPPKKA